MPHTLKHWEQMRKAQARRRAKAKETRLKRGAPTPGVSATPEIMYPVSHREQDLEFLGLSLDKKRDVGEGPSWPYTSAEREAIKTVQAVQRPPPSEPAATAIPVPIKRPAIAPTDMAAQAIARAAEERPTGRGELPKGRSFWDIMSTAGTGRPDATGIPAEAAIAQSKGLTTEDVLRTIDTATAQTTGRAYVAADPFERFLAEKARAVGEASGNLPSWLGLGTGERLITGMFGPPDRSELPSLPEKIKAYEAQGMSNNEARVQVLREAKWGDRLFQELMVPGLGVVAQPTNVLKNIRSLRQLANIGFHGVAPTIGQRGLGVGLRGAEAVVTPFAAAEQAASEVIALPFRAGAGLWRFGREAMQEGLASTIRKRAADLGLGGAEIVAKDPTLARQLALPPGRTIQPVQSVGQRGLPLRTADLLLQETTQSFPTLGTAEQAGLRVPPRSAPSGEPSLMGQRMRMVRRGAIPEEVLPEEPTYFTRQEVDVKIQDLEEEAYSHDPSGGRFSDDPKAQSFLDNVDAEIEFFNGLKEDMPYTASYRTSLKARELYEELVFASGELRGINETLLEWSRIDWPYTRKFPVMASGVNLRRVPNQALIDFNDQLANPLDMRSTDWFDSIDGDAFRDWYVDGELAARYARGETKSTLQKRRNQLLGTARAFFPRRTKPGAPGKRQLEELTQTRMGVGELRIERRQMETGVGRSIKQIESELNIVRAQQATEEAAEARVTQKLLPPGKWIGQRIGMTEKRRVRAGVIKAQKGGRPLLSDSDWARVEADLAENRARLEAQRVEPTPAGVRPGTITPGTITPEGMTPTGIKKSSADWEKIYEEEHGVILRNYAGWKKGPEFSKDWAKPITRGEFQAKVDRSRIELVGRGGVRTPAPIPVTDAMVDAQQARVTAAYNEYELARAQVDEVAAAARLRLEKSGSTEILNYDNSPEFRAAILRRDNAEAAWEDALRQLNRLEEQLAEAPIRVTPTVSAARATRMTPDPAPIVSEEMPIDVPIGQQSMTGEPRLPKILGGARSRYKGNQLIFESDVDKALYVVAPRKSGKLSKRDAAYMAWLRPLFPALDTPKATDDMIRGRGATVRAHIKEQVKRHPPTATVRIPKSSAASQVYGGGRRITPPGITPIGEVQRLPTQTRPRGEGLPFEGGPGVQPETGQGPADAFDQGTQSRTGMLDDEGIPGGPTGRARVEPFPDGDDIPGDEILIEFSELDREVTKVNSILNRARQFFSRIGGLGEFLVPDDPRVQPFLEARRKFLQVGESVAARFGQENYARLKEVFAFDKQGRIISLAHLIKEVGAPTISDLAARLPIYRTILTDPQVEALRHLSKEMDRAKAVLEKAGIEIDTMRPDIMDGGFYVPRGDAYLEMQMKADGYVDTVLWDSDAPIAKISSGKRIRSGEEGFEKPAMFASEAEGIDAGYEYPRIADRLTMYIDGIVRRSAQQYGDDYFEQFAISEGGKYIDISIAPGLSELGFPVKMTNAIDKILREEGPPRGGLRMIAWPMTIVNRIRRTFGATGDDSSIGIQGLAAVYNDPKAALKAMRVNIEGLYNEDALGEFFVRKTAEAVARGLLTPAQWARRGLRLGAKITEFRAPFSLEKMKVVGPVFERFNRIFGYMGDSVRIGWANDMLVTESQRLGLTVEEMVARGEIERIASIANAMTGWSERRFAGNLGDVLAFAPRFLQSRLESVAWTARGFVPFRSTPIQARIARRSFLRMVGTATVMTVGINYMLGQPTDLRPIVNGKWNSNFLRIRIFGRDYSMLGQWDSLARLIVTLGMAPVNLAATGSFNSEHEAVRSMTSGTVSNAWDFITGETAMGKASRDTPAQILKRLGTNFVPFSFSETPEIAGRVTGGDPLGAGAVVVGEGLGVKSAELSFIDVSDVEVGKISGNTYYEESERWIRSWAGDIARIRVGSRPPPHVEVADEKFKDLEAIVKDYPDRADFSVRYMQHNAEFRRVMEDATANYDFRDIKINVDDPIDVAFGEYYALLDDPRYQKPNTGDIDWDKFNAAMDALPWTKEQRDAIERSRHRGPYPVAFLYLIAPSPDGTKAGTAEWYRINKSQDLREKWLRDNGKGNLIPLLRLSFLGQLSHPPDPATITEESDIRDLGVPRSVIEEQSLRSIGEIGDRSLLNMIRTTPSRLKTPPRVTTPYKQIRGITRPAIRTIQGVFNNQR